VFLVVPFEYQRFGGVRCQSQACQMRKNGKANSAKNTLAALLERSMGWADYRLRREHGECPESEATKVTSPRLSNLVLAVVGVTYSDILQET